MLDRRTGQRRARPQVRVGQRALDRALLRFVDLVFGERHLARHRQHLVGAGAPGHVRFDLAGVEHVFHVEPHAGIAVQRLPVLQRGVALGAVVIATDIRRAAQHIVDGGLVRRNQRAARGGLDRHVAQREAGFDAQLADRRATVLHHVATRTLCADRPDDAQDQVLGGGAERQLAVHADAHGLCHPVDQRLRGQHVLDLGRADAKAQRAERTVGGGVAVAADHHHARPDHAVLGRHHVLDALQRVVGVEQRDRVPVAIAAQIRGLQRRRRIGDHADRAGVRGDDMADHGHVLPRHQHAAPLLMQAGEGLRTGVFVHQVQVAIQQHVVVVDPGDGMGVDQLLVQGPGCHG
ncbi:hypothetical protein D3C81_940600 [compost metagenome]